MSDAPMPIITFPKPAAAIVNIVNVLVFDGGHVIAGRCMHAVSLHEYCADCAAMPSVEITVAP